MSVDRQRSLPGKIGIDAENGQQHNFQNKHGFEGLEEICLKIIKRDDKAHMGRCQHLPGYAEGHSYAGQIQVAGREGGNDRHDDRYMAL